MRHNLVPATENDGFTAHRTAKRIIAFCLFGVNPLSVQVRNQHAALAAQSKTCSQRPGNAQL
jgi:hypothetical protein